ncbi:MAG: hypothetical protein KAJ86_03175 [Alphaproteobacteria bacterium]|nr:hypothetical protein [Alphaproteobacteria bacterium]
MNKEKTTIYIPYILLTGMYVLSIVLSLFAGENAAIRGVLLIIWGFFVLLQNVWMIEIIKTKDQSNLPKTNLLPQIILNSMKQRQNINKVRLAIQIFNKPVLLWFFFMGMYVLSTLYNNLLPSVDTQTKILIDVFLANENLHAHAMLQKALMSISHLLIIGLIFFIIPTYAYDRKHTNLLFCMTLSAFIISQCKALFLISIFTYNIPDISKEFFLYLAFGITIIIFLRFLFQNKNNILYASIGLCTLFIMGIDYVFIPRIDTFAIWLSGWSIIAITWGYISR